MTIPHATAHDGIFFSPTFTAHDGFVAIGGLLGRACLGDESSSTGLAGERLAAGALAGLGVAASTLLGLGHPSADVNDTRATSALAGEESERVEGEARVGLSGSTACAGLSGSTASAGAASSTACAGLSGSTAETNTSAATATAGDTTLRCNR